MDLGLSPNSDASWLGHLEPSWAISLPVSGLGFPVWTMWMA